MCILQINIGKVNTKTGLYTGEYKSFALNGYIRAKGEADNAFNVLTKDVIADVLH